ncbi:DNA polymerase I [Desulfurispora thermophila]|uniref:DNA polymerase I n=1 Tax=Desulfurispora thermophila TaxID=265470 RepID=UPI00036A13AB|nr:DNA polymerase I [Desulfurispora thermophila]
MSSFLLIVDGNSLAYRAFHAMSHLRTSTGIPTGAVFGFTSMLLKLLHEKKPAYLAVCFDKSRINFRHSRYAAYKANRRETPEELRPQFPLIKEVLDAMNITILEKDNYEADDLIGTVARLATAQDIPCLILTGDQDTLQLVSPLVRVLLTKKGISRLEEYTEEKVAQKFGCLPPYLPDYKGLAGDSADNIPGVPGIGDKTAVNLLKTYGNLEEILRRLDELPPRLAGKLAEHASAARLYRDLARIDCQVPLTMNIASLKWTGWQGERLLAVFQKLEFRSLTNQINNLAPNRQKQKEQTMPQPAAVQNNNNMEKAGTDFRPATLLTESNLEQTVSMMKRAGEIALAFTGGKEAARQSLALDAGEECFLLDLSPAAIPAEKLALLLRDLFAPGISYICHDAKTLAWLLYRYQVQPPDPAFDTSIAAYLLNPGSGPRGLGELAMEYLQATLPPPDPDSLPEHARCVRRLRPVLDDALDRTDMRELYYSVELPLVRILAEMEMAGIAVDKKQLQIMSDELEERLQQISTEIYRLAGEPFNINSPKQLGQILFEKLGLPVIKRTKTGYSTDAEVLEELSAVHPLVGLVLQHRQLAKLKSTYCDGLATLIDPQSGLIHTTLHQNVTATGRLSSSDPNLQNIPIRLPEGRRIRRVFRPPTPGYILLTADYSQIELRVLAHLAQDPLLKEAFLANQDIHTRTAAEVFGVPLEQVTPEMRNRAKAVNFGIVYGISDFGLARDLKISRGEARRYIDSYFARYPGVKKFMEQSVALAREQGYVTTLLNRRRYIPDVNSKNFAVRSAGERAAMNTPVQGSAADIIKLAMVRLSRELKKAGLKARLLLQVHDELILEALPEEVPALGPLLRYCMEQALPLSVPLRVDMKQGPNWYEMEKI